MVEGVPQTGWYKTRHGDRWFVVVRENGNVVCHDEKGSFTAAFADTFRAWGWVPEDAPAGRAALEAHNG